MNTDQIKIGQAIRLPVYPERELLEGTVIYVHPKKRFFRVEFSMDTGDAIRESFPTAGPIVPKP